MMMDQLPKQTQKVVIMFSKMTGFQKLITKVEKYHVFQKKLNFFFILVMI